MEEQDEGAKQDPKEQNPADSTGGFSGMESLGRSFLEKSEQAQSDLKALRDMHRRRTREKPADREVE